MKDKIICYPKINIGLNFYEKDKLSQKHNLESLFMKFINNKYYDILEIEEANNTTIFYDGDNIKNCLIQKTINFLKQNDYIDHSLNFKINICKKIPIGSGLGGGSSNVGEFIRYLIRNKYIKKNLNLYDVARFLGSDIPFFINGNKWAIVSGIGDIITPININTDLKINIYFPRISIFTQNIFDNFINIKNNKKLNNFNKIISDINNNIIPLEIYNDLEPCVLSLNSELNVIYECYKKDNDIVFISGSGSTLVMMNSDKKIRTRYAPSPTGYFHIGGARTAIFNYLFAKHYKGDFIVRIEDTDVERNVEGGIESQLSNLAWMKIVPDESVNNPGKYGPYIQSAKLDRYKTLAHDLLAKGLAYRCFCTEEQLENDRQQAIDNHQTPKYNRRCFHLSDDEIKNHLANNTPYVIRLKINDNTTYGWEDVVRGKIDVPSSAMTDPVILKSNGIAMYNFAVVVDDFDMEITHVLRGEEHISNTPYQIAIRDSLGFNNGIQYGHLSVIIDESGKKLSKRNKTLKQFVQDYKNMGFIPESIDNFLSLLGWTPSNNQEILSIDELIADFNINNISKSPTFFDFKKLLWIGNEYFKKMDNDSYLNFVLPFINTKNCSSWIQNHISSVALLFKNQISYADQINDLISEYFINNHKLNNEEIEIIQNNIDVVNKFKSLIETTSVFNEQNIVDIINHVKTETGKKGKDLFMPIRLCATRMSHGPELAKMIYFTSQEKVLINIKEVLNKGE